MTVLIAVLGALAGALWAFTHFVGAAREGTDAIRDVRGAFRSASWSKRVGERLIETLTDPKEAAAVLLCQVAAYDGVVTERQRKTIVADMKGRFRRQ